MEGKCVIEMCGIALLVDGLKIIDVQDGETPEDLQEVLAFLHLVIHQLIQEQDLGMQLESVI